MRSKVIVIVSLLLSVLTAGAQEESGSQMGLLNFKSASEGFSVDVSPQVYERQHGEWPYDNNGNEPCACIIVKFEQMPLAEIGNLVYRFMGSDIKGEPELHLEEAEPFAILFVDPSKVLSMWVTHPKYGTSSRISNRRVDPKQVYEVTLKNARTVTVVVTTEPSGLVVVLSDLDIRGTSPATFTDVPLGKHHLRISHNGSVLKEKEITVSDENVYFPYDVREKKTIRFVSSPSGASLSLDGKLVGETPLSLELPYGSYNVKALIGTGQSSQKYVVVNEMTAEEIDLGEIRAEETSTKPEHERGSGSGKKFYEKVSSLGFGMSYVSKGLVTKGEGETIKESGAWGADEGSTSLGGIQVGLRVQPFFGAGVGLNTGIYYEFYSSTCDGSEYDKFTEHCIYIPIHVLYSLPMGGKTAVRFHGGLGISTALQGKYKDSSGTNEDLDSFYGNDLYPKKTNVTLDLGVGLRLGPIQLNAQYGMGVIDHKTYASYGDYKTKQNKLTFGVSFLFGDIK